MSEHAAATREMPVTGKGASAARAPRILLYFCLATLGIWLLSGFYKVGPDQVAIVERLGQYLTTSSGKIIEIEHGLHYHLPWPIDRVSVISTQQNFTMVVNEFNASPTAYDNFKRDLMKQGADQVLVNALFDPYLITADKSVAHVEVSVNFHINDAAAWLTSVSHEYHQTYVPDAADDMRNQLFQQLAQRALVFQVAHMELDQVVREGRAALERNVLRDLQNVMQLPDPGDPTGKSRISLGVSIQSVPISDSKVPDAVKPAFDNLINQKNRAETVKKMADAEAKGAVAKAEGEKDSLILDARTYSLNVVQAAKGEAERFGEVLKQYNNAPDITRSNLLVDSLQSVAGNAKRIVFAQPGQKTIIVVDPPQYDGPLVKPGN